MIESSEADYVLHTTIDVAANLMKQSICILYFSLSLWDQNVTEQVL